MILGLFVVDGFDLQYAGGKIATNNAKLEEVCAHCPYNVLGIGCNWSIFNEYGSLFM